MALVLLLVMTAWTVAVVAYWCVVEDRADSGTKPRTSMEGVPAWPESLKGALVARLVAAEITRRQYLQAMGGIAAREDLRHPLTVPPEAGPADV